MRTEQDKMIDAKKVELGKARQEIKSIRVALEKGIDDPAVVEVCRRALEYSAGKAARLEQEIEDAKTKAG